MPTKNGFKSNEPRCCTSQITERYRPWYAFFSLKTKQMDFKEQLFIAPTKDCFSAIDACYLFKAMFRFLQDSCHHECHCYRLSTAALW